MIRVLDSDLCHKRTDEQKEGLYISHGAPIPEKPMRMDFVHKRWEEFSARIPRFMWPRCYGIRGRELDC
jgi:hypothetical protein